MRLLGATALILSMAMLKSAHAGQSPLLELAHKLHCTQTEQEAAVLLSTLSSLSMQPFGIPSDTLGTDEKSLLYAATVDILLKVLYETIQHYPKLQEPAERLALLWNYCEVMTDDGIADLAVNPAGKIVKQQAIYHFPENKQGLGIWGFLKPDPENRYVPKIILDMSVWPRAQEELIFRLVQQQCFPHPSTGTLVNESGNLAPLSFGSPSINPALKLNKHYPYFWQSGCSEATPPIPTIKQAPPQTAKMAPKVAVSPAFSDTVKPIKPKPVENSKPDLPAKATVATAKHIEKPVEEKKNGLASILKNYAPPENEEFPIISPAIAGENSNSGAGLPLPPKNGRGIAGNFYNRSKLTGAQSIGTNISWRPVSHFFVRGGLNYNYYPDNGQFSYSWGIGYDDWHPGTLSVQLNNWGPVTPGNDLALKGVVVTVGYKFKAEILKPYHITGSIAANIPISGDPNISTTWNWSPIENWFIRASLQKKFGNQDGWNWSYNFGYFDWHPFTFSISYDNWGTNPIWDSKQGDTFNFQENGAVSLSWSWAF